jgi:hypothetical protein
MSYEVALLLLAFVIDEILPFIPNKYNGLAQSALELLSKVRLRKDPDNRIEILIDKIEKLTNEIEKD